MSASKDRINRKKQIEAGTDKRTIAAAEEAKKRRKTNIQYTVIAVILVLFFAFIFTYNSNFPSRHTTAVSIDGTNYSVAQTNYYYSTSYMSFYNNYYSYVNAGLFFDPQESLDDQAYSEDMSWRDYFLQSAVDSMTEVQILNNAAEAEGFTLSEEDQAAYDEAVAQLETNWADLGYSSLDQYISMNYGKGVDFDMVKQEMYRTTLASAYSQYLYNGYEYTAQDLADYYAEHADEYDRITYAYYTDTEGAVDADAATAALNGKTEADFTAYMEENYEGAAPTTLTYAGSSLSEAYSEWLLDAARKTGDVTAIEDGDTTTILMFLGRDTNDYNTVAFRHILVMAEDADGDGVYSEEEQAAALARAEELYAEWQAGDATEDSFAELADANSEDSGSNTNGGLYETVIKGQMVEPIDEWLFDAARKAGDTTVVSYDGANYTGAHVVFFVGQEDMTYADSLADSALRNEAYSTWMEEAEEAASVTTSHLGMCGKNH